MSGFFSILKQLRFRQPTAPEENASRTLTAVEATIPVAVLGHAVHLHQSGHLARAEHAYKEILKAQPRNFDALHLLGVIEIQKGNNEDAVRLIDAALKVESRSPFALSNRGLALQGLGRLEESLANYDAAITLKPDNADALYNRGNVLRDLKRYEEALQSYDQAVGVRPDHTEALNGRGNTLKRLGRHSDALASYDRAIAIRPDQPIAFNNRGAALEALRRYDEALHCYDKAVALLPGYAEAFINRGNVLQYLGKYEEALASYSRAIAVRPDCTEALYSRALALKNLKRYAEAQKSCEEALAVNPGYTDALVVLFEIQGKCCDWGDRSARLQELVARCASGEPISPFTFLWAVDAPEVHLKASKSWVREFYPPRDAPIVRTVRQRPKVRVAYVSADFQMHATAHLMSGLFERHDRHKFEVYGISLKPSDGSPIRARLEAAFDSFVNAESRPDWEIAQLLRELEIDIVVDLKGFTEDSRPGIFAYRPAPISVSYLGYPGTTGAAYIDYVIADAYVVPEEMKLSYCEQVVYLPDTYQVNDSGRTTGTEELTRADVGLPSNGFVFCSFNNNYKCTPELFDIWMNLLRKVDRSVLWLYTENESSSENLLKEARARGVGADRLVFARHVDFDRHLSRLRLGDLFLDTFPYNAHTTASDALWMGLPVLTCSGRSFPSRVAGSLLRAAGIPELITQSMQDYEALGLRLATDGQLLSGIKARLERNRKACALFDTDRFRRHLESAYMTMLEIRQRGEKPGAFSVDPIDQLQ